MGPYELYKILALVIVVIWIILSIVIALKMLKARNKEKILPENLLNQKTLNKEGPINKFKELLEAKLDVARASLLFQDILQPFFFTFVDGKINETPVTLDDENKDVEMIEARTMCSYDNVQAAALLFDCYSKTGATKEINSIEDSGEDLKNVEGSTENILIFLYTREGTWCRTISYVKRGEQDYWFGDMGWEIVPNCTGLFSNPFEK